jgi:hypothetical protein
VADLLHFGDAAAEENMAGRPSFFDLSVWHEALSAADNLFARLVVFVVFEVLVVHWWQHPNSVRGKRRPVAIRPVLMLKTLC